MGLYMKTFHTLLNDLQENEERKIYHTNFIKSMESIRFISENMTTCIFIAIVISG